MKDLVQSLFVRNVEKEIMTSKISCKDHPYAEVRETLSVLTGRKFLTCLPTLGSWHDIEEIT